MQKMTLSFKYYPLQFQPSLSNPQRQKPGEYLEGECSKVRKNFTAIIPTKWNKSSGVQYSKEETSPREIISPIPSDFQGLVLLWSAS